MDSGKRVSITFKPSRLTKVLETNTSCEMAKVKNKASAVTQPAALDKAVEDAAVKGPTAAMPDEKG